MIIHAVSFVTLFINISLNLMDIIIYIRLSFPFFLILPGSVNDLLEVV